MADKTKSIYQQIYDDYINSHDLPCKNYDIETAGKSDTLFVLWGEELPSKVLRARAQNLLDLVFLTLNDDACCEKLSHYLEEYSFIQYYFSFCKLLELHIKESLIDKNKLYQLGFKLSTESSSSNDVKLGMTILGLSQYSSGLKILSILGLHSEYTFYAIASAINHPYYNSFVFDMAKKTCGYGKFHCLKTLEPINDAIKNWIIENGCADSVLRNLSAIICVEKVDMSWYLKNNIIGQREFHNISRLLYYIFSVKENNIYELDDSFDAINLYMEYAPLYVDSFEDLCALAYINRQLSNCSHYGNISWTAETIGDVKNKCRNLLTDAAYVPVLKKSIEEASEDPEHYIFVAESMKINLSFAHFKNMLSKDPYNLDIYFYIANSLNENDMKSLIDFAKNNLPLDVILKGPEDIGDEDLTYENKPDICLLYILCNLEKYKFIELHLPVISLFARFPKCRIEAIKYLKKIKPFWKPNVLESLKLAETLEPCNSIKRKIKRLLGEGDSPSKERKYTDISSVTVKPHYKDIYLFSTKVAGMYYRDMGVVEDEIERGDIVFLKREPTNPYDKKAIMVTTDDGYIIGYIPKNVNELPKNLMDNGKYLYGIVKDFNIDENHMNIDIYLSHRDVIDSVHELMRLFNEDSGGFIN